MKTTKIILIIFSTLISPNLIQAQDCDIWLNNMATEVENRNTDEAVKMMKWFINCKGNELGVDNPIIKKLETISYIPKFKDGISICQLNNGESAIINEALTEIISLEKYGNSLFEVSEGFISVVLNGKVGYIDVHGNEVIPFKYDFGGYFSEGLANVNLNGKWGYIDKTGNEFIPFQYDYTAPFSNGLAMIKLNEKYGYIDKSNQLIIPVKYDFGERFSEGLARVILNRKSGYIDKKGNEIVPFKYDIGYSFVDGVAQVSLNNKCGYVDKSGKEITTLKYEVCSLRFSEGLAWVSLNWKYGFVNQTGEEVIPHIYDYANNFSQGKAEVEIKNKVFSIDRTGKCITDCQNAPAGHP